MQPVSHHGPRLVCYWREQCVRTGPVPGKFLSSLPLFLVLFGKLFSLGLFISLVILYIFRLKVDRLMLPIKSLASKM